MRRPKLAAGLAVAGLVDPGDPAFGLHTANSGTSGLPKDMPIVKTLDRVEAAFPGGVEPAEVAISAADVKAPAVADAVEALRERLAADPANFGRPQSLPGGARTARSPNSRCRSPATGPTRAPKRR